MGWNISELFNFNPSNDKELQVQWSGASKLLTRSERNGCT